MTLPFHTIGHSDRSLDDFLALLDEAGIGLVADVRRLPGSRAHPQFDGPALEQVLASRGIAYRHFPDLGGRRGRAAGVDPAVNAFWINTSFHNYADHALGQPFHAALALLLAEGAATRTAVMCAEAVWWRCHRRIIADYLIAAGCSVIHIMGPDRTEPARLTEGAVPRGDGSLAYPAAL